MFRIGMVLMGLLLVVGCVGPQAVNQPAVVADGMIRNPTVGWSGYCVAVPEGMTLFNPAQVSADDPAQDKRHRDFVRFDQRMARNSDVDYSEHFLLECSDPYCSIFFRMESLNLPVGWSFMDSVKRRKVFEHLIWRAKLVMSDSDASSTRMSINDRPACLISGEGTPLFFKVDRDQACETIILLGRLKDYYILTGHCAPEDRLAMRSRLCKMAESLQVH